MPHRTSRMSTSKFRDWLGHSSPCSNVRQALLPTQVSSRASGIKNRKASVDPPIPNPCGRLNPFRFRYWKWLLLLAAGGRRTDGGDAGVVLGSSGQMK